MVNKSNDVIKPKIIVVPILKIVEETIAGITNNKGNVLGMMPHPERACDDALGNIDGKSILSTLLS